MDELRCPGCSARVSADADWCTLCFARLRAEPVAPVSAPVSYAAASSVHTDRASAAPPVSAYDPLTAPLAALAELAGTTAPPDAASTHSDLTVTEAGAAAATWPCHRCEARVSIDLDACHVCGGPFLLNDSDLHIPLIGDATQIDTAKKVWIMVGGALGIMAVLTILALLVGLVI